MVRRSVVAMVTMRVSNVLMMMLFLMIDVLIAYAGKNMSLSLA